MHAWTTTTSLQDKKYTMYKNGHTMQAKKRTTLHMSLQHNHKQQHTKQQKKNRRPKSVTEEYT